MMSNHERIHETVVSLHEKRHPRVLDLHLRFSLSLSLDKNTLLVSLSVMLAMNFMLNWIGQDKIAFSSFFLVVKKRILTSWREMK
jgi:hypothetical protein